MAPSRPWESFQKLATFQSRARELYDGLWAPSCAGANRGSWAPPVDVCETDRELVVSLDVPGLKDGEIAITLDGRRLSVSGGRPRPRLDVGGRLHRFERSFGPFRRELTLPCAVTALDGEIGSSYEDGVLEVRIAKADAREPQHVSVAAALAEQSETVPVEEHQLAAC